ncbi:unnamed protein product [Symbiodinium sp. CCMP2456]|nr:unnamed protein product [Symbiodinium sp. CCMP2456]
MAERLKQNPDLSICINREGGLCRLWRKVHKQSESQETAGHAMPWPHCWWATHPMGWTWAAHPWHEYTGNAGQHNAQAQAERGHIAREIWITAGDFFESFCEDLRSWFADVCGPAASASHCHSLLNKLHMRQQLFSGLCGALTAACSWEIAQGYSHRAWQGLKYMCWCLRTASETSQPVLNQWI